MMRPASMSTLESPAGSREAGATLVEVLVAIFVMGIGLLALLTLFPLGALSMAEEIKDDRTAAAADDAVQLAAAGEQLLSETAAFVADSIAHGSVDPKTAAAVREKYESLLHQADDLEEQLRALKDLFPPPVIQPHLGPLLAQLRAIKSRIVPVIQLLQLAGGAS
jgi:Prokaryotic N-terminal methylation motif